MQKVHVFTQAVGVKQPKKQQMHLCETREIRGQ